MAFNNSNFDDFDMSGGFGGSTSSFDDDFSSNSSFDSGGFDSFGFDGNHNSQPSNSGFGNDNTGFGNDGGSGNQPAGNEFENLFTDNVNSSDDNDSNSLKKTAILAVIIGIVVIFGVIGVATLVKNKDKEKPNENGITIVEQPVEQQKSPTQQAPVQVQQNADDIMQSGNEPVSNTTVNVDKDRADGWIVIDDKQEVVFNAEYKDLMFFITGIEHRAKMSDNSILVKTVLTGSLSGMSGTYEMEVPYHKGVKLLVGQEFTVKVLIGSFNGKTVVGDIKY